VRLRGWGFPFGRLYDRLVLGPATARRRGRGGRWLVRLGRGPLGRAWAALFALDARLPAGDQGSGWLAVGRKAPPGRAPGS
jgi:hypothetical protein